MRPLISCVVLMAMLAVTACSSSDSSSVAADLPTAETVVADSPAVETMPANTATAGGSSGDVSAPTETSTSSEPESTTTDAAADSTTTTQPLDPAQATRDVEFLAEVLDLDVLVARVPGDDTTVYAWNSETTVSFADPGWPWSDGSFIYSAHWTGDESRSIVRDLEGLEVCAFEGIVSHVTRRDDGSLVASTTDGSSYAVENGWTAEAQFALECSTGDRQPIAAVRFFDGEAGSMYIESTGGRTFTHFGDAEGNAQVLNEAGVSVNGDRYAGGHVFDATGRLVVYGDYGLGASALITAHIALADTETGQQRWAHELPAPFNYLGFTEDGRVIAAIPPAASAWEPWRGTERVFVFDAATGDIVADVATALFVHHAS